MKSWIHLILCKADYKNLTQFIEKGTNFEYLVSTYALVDGIILLGDNAVERDGQSPEFDNDRYDAYFGEPNKKSLVVFTQSNEGLIDAEIVSNEVIDNVKRVLPLDYFKPSELQYSSQGTRIKKASYLTKEEFLEHLEHLELSEEYNNLGLQRKFEFESTGVAFIQHMCAIIIDILSYMNYKRTEEIEGLFIDATKLFNALGLWVMIFSADTLTLSVMTC